MKRLLFILMAVFLLVACGNKVESNDNEMIDVDAQEDEIETISEKDIDLILFDNEELSVKLLKVAHGRSELTDHVSLKIEIENKQNKTFELLLKEISVDGQKIESTQSWLSDDEIKPNETIDTIINGYEHEELTVGEHIAGAIIYKDFEGVRKELEFSEYIND